MDQKYKFFIKAKAVTVVENPQSIRLSTDRESFLIQALQRGDIEEDETLEVRNANVFYKHLLRGMEHIVAGGGYVLNPGGKLLMIYRKGMWDLPKGKQDTGEDIRDTAMREVMEECGIQGLVIASAPFSTFHIYQESDHWVLKESVWFRMFTSDDRALEPQLEEGITKASWVELPVDSSLMEACYPSIREVINHFSLYHPRG